MVILQAAADFEEGRGKVFDITAATTPAAVQQFAALNASPEEYSPSEFGPAEEPLADTKEDMELEEPVPRSCDTNEVKDIHGSESDSDSHLSAWPESVKEKEDGEEMEPEDVVDNENGIIRKAPTHSLALVVAENQPGTGSGTISESS